MAMLKELAKSVSTGHPAEHQPGAPILDVDHLTVNYDHIPALEDVTFRPENGERVAVVGPNGAGKSTLFKVIAGVLAPSSGEVRVSGQGPGGHICIAYLPQRSHVDLTFPVSVADVVMMGRIRKMGLLTWPRRKDWAQVQRALEMVGLEDLADRQISELSGGQQQRMFIARALAQEAELILMDEPLSGLDINSEELIFKILDDLRRLGVTVLIAIHDLQLAADRFDRVLLLNHRLIGFGYPVKVFTRENLMQAYGGHLHGAPAEEINLMTLDDTCCEDGDEI